MSKEDKNMRKLLDEITGILKDKVPEDVLKTVIGKAEKLSFQESKEQKSYWGGAILLEEMEQKKTDPKFKVGDEVFYINNYFILKGEIIHKENENFIVKILEPEKDRSMNRIFYAFKDRPIYATIEEAQYNFLKIQIEEAKALTVHYIDKQIIWS